MTPRDRVLAAVAGEEVFPIPLHVFENAVYPQLEAALCRHFGLAEADHAGVLEALGAEIRRGSCLYVGPPADELPGQVARWPFKKVFRNAWGTWEGYETYSDAIERPLRLAQTVADVDRHRWPDPAWFDYHRVGWFYDTPETYLPIPLWVERRVDYARLIGGWNPVSSRVLDLFGMETGLMDAGMDPAALKMEFGSHLTCHGAFDSQQLLMTASPHAVRAEVRRLVETLGRGGRYIFCSMHFLVDRTPVDNVLAMYDEARRFRPARASEVKASQKGARFEGPQ